MRKMSTICKTRFFPRFCFFPKPVDRITYLLISKAKRNAQDWQKIRDSNTGLPFAIAFFFITQNSDDSNFDFTQRLVYVYNLTKFFGSEEWECTPSKNWERKCERTLFNTKEWEQSETLKIWEHWTLCYFTK